MLGLEYDTPIFCPGRGTEREERGIDTPKQSKKPVSICFAYLFICPQHAKKYPKSRRIIDFLTRNFMNDDVENLNIQLEPILFRYFAVQVLCLPNLSGI